MTWPFENDTRAVEKKPESKSKEKLACCGGSIDYNFSSNACFVCW